MNSERPESPVRRDHRPAAAVVDARTVQYVETYRFSKSVTDGGLAQMERLLQFGRARSRFTGLPGGASR